MDEKEILRELLEEFRMFKETLSGINSNAKELSEDQKKANAELKKQNEAGLAAKKKADEDEAKQAWEKLTEEEKQLELARMQAKKEADERNAQIEKEKAYGKAKSEIQESQKKYLQQRSDYELKSYGYIKDSQDRYHKLIDSREQNEKNLLEHFSKILAQDPAENAKFGGDAEAAKLAADQDRMFKQQLASMNRYLNENNKIIDSTVRLTKEQEKVIKAIKDEEAALQKGKDMMEEFKSYFGKKGIIAAVGVAFDLLKAGLVGTYKGLINYENALLDGQRGQAALAELVTARMEEQAAVLDKLGGGFSAFGGQMITAAMQMAMVNAPMALLTAAIGGLLAIVGIGIEAEAADLRRRAELEKRRGKLESDLYQRFQELGEASMTGARGATELKEQLSKVGLTILEFDKLNKVLAANSKEIAMFGIGVEGVNKYVEVTGDLINNADSLSKTFEKMGISQQAQREHTEKYMALQARLGMLQGKTTDQLRKGTENYILELDKTAALTGLNRKDQEQAREAVMAEKSLRAAMLKAQAENNTVELARLQRYAELSKYYEASGQTEEAAGIRKYAAGGVTDEQTAYVSGVMGATFDRIDKGIGTPLGDIADSMKLLNDRYLQFADVLKITGNISGLTGDVAKFADANISIAKAMADLSKTNPNATVDDLNKILAEMRKPATDDRTEKDLKAARDTQADALKKQEALLNGELSAIETMKTAVVDFAGIIKGAFTSAIDKFENVINDLWNKIKDWNPFKDNSPTTPDAPFNSVARLRRQGATSPMDYNIDNIYGDTAPRMAEGGIIPGTTGGTTVAVGEKGKPEAIIPLDQIKGIMGNLGSKDNNITLDQLKGITGNFGSKDNSVPMDQLKGTMGNFGSKDNNVTLDQLKGIMVGNTDRDAIIIRLDTTNNNLIQTNNKILESNTKILDSSQKQIKLAEDTNKLMGAEGPLIKSINALKASDDALAMSMTKVTDMLPNTLAQIVSVTSSGVNGTGGTTPFPQASTPGGTVKASSDMLRQSGLILKPGDTQRQDGDIDPKLVEIAKQVQASIPNFMQFTGFNDQFHNENTPGSKHTTGKAFDFVLNKVPSKDEGNKILAQLKTLGIDYAQDEYNNPSSGATGGHIHAQLNAYDGGVFEPRPGGVHVKLAEAGLKEAAFPLNPGEKIRIENAEANSPRKEPLKSVLSDNDSNSFIKTDMAAQILTELHDLMESKLDSMIAAIKDGNDISDKLLKYSQV